MTDKESALDTNALIVRMNNVGGLHELLADPSVKAELLQALRDHEVPVPGLVYRLILAIAGRSESFLGDIVSSRLRAFIERTPKLANLVQRIANLQHGARAKEALRTELLDALRSEQNTPASVRYEVDDASPLDLVLALHSVKGFESLLAGLDDQTQVLLNGIKRELDNLFQKIVEPTLFRQKEADAAKPLGAFDRLKYTAGLDPLLGREMEIDLLHRFVGDPSMTGEQFNFRWLLLTAPGGSGKTRLAFEFTHKHLDRDRWYAGRVKLQDRPGLSDPAKWRPRQPTFLVVDYAQTKPELVRDLILALAGNAKHFDVPVRLLLLERTADRTWTDRVFPDDGFLPMVLEHSFGQLGIDGYILRPLPRRAIIDLMAWRFEKAGLPAPSREALLEEAVKIDPRGELSEPEGITVPRPLFALAAAEEWIATTMATGASEIAPPAFDRETVFSRIIRREREKRWQPAALNDGELRQYEMALALATYIQGLSMTELTDKKDRFGRAAHWLPHEPPQINDALWAAIGGVDGYLEPLEPDLLGEFFVLETLTQTKAFGQAERTAFLIGGATLNEPHPMVMLLRAGQDFAARLDDLDLPNVIRACTSVEMAMQFSWFATDYVALSARQERLNQGIAVLDAVEYLRVTFPEEPKIGLDEAKAAVNGIALARPPTDWPRIDGLFDRIEALRKVSPDNPELGLIEAQAAANGITLAGTVQDWPRVDALFARIDVLRKVFPGHPGIALREAFACVNGVADAGTAKDWPRIDALLNRIDALRKAFPDHPELGFREAQAAFNGVVLAGTAQDWIRIDALFGRIEALRVAFPDHLDIALAEAQAAGSGIVDAGTVQHWPRVDALFNRIGALRAAFPNHSGIALEEALAAVNGVNHACTAQDWPQVDALFDRIDVLRKAFPDHPEIAQREAHAVVNGVAHAGAGQDWPRFDELSKRIDALRKAFPDHSGIALRKAQAAAYGIGHGGTARGWPWVDVLFAQIDALRVAFPDHPEIAMAEARATTSGLSHAANARDSTRFDALLARFRLIAQQWGEEFVIIEHEGQKVTLGGVIEKLEANLRLGRPPS